MISMEFFELVQKKCLPGVWSKGVSLSRGSGVTVDSDQNEEMIVRVLAPDHPVSRKVSLWPEDEDWHCDCENRLDVCAHVVAALIVLKTRPARSAAPAEGAPTSRKSTVAQIRYRLSRKNGELTFERWIVQTEVQQNQLTDSLVSFVGGVNSGRIASLPVSATKEDFTVDSALGERKRGELDRSTWLRLFKVLAQSPFVELDGVPVKVSAQPLRFSARLTEERGGFRLKQEKDTSVTEAFKNGAVLCGNTLKAVDMPSLTTQERDWLGGEGKFFPRSEMLTLLGDILPALEAKMTVLVPPTGLPEVKRVPPKIVFQLDVLEGDRDEKLLSIVPRVVYEGSENRTSTIYLPDPLAEKSLHRKIQNELQLSPGQRLVLSGQTAVDFCLRLKGWEIDGKGAEAFELKSGLKPQLNMDESDFQVTFSVQDQATGKEVFADFGRVFQAWRENSHYVPLLTGGWAALPNDWLNRYGERIAALLAAKESAGGSSRKKLPVFLVPELMELGDELGTQFPDPIQKLRESLNQIERIEPAPFPADLKATLRHYQELGVNWLMFLRKLGVGALLADDMGLGKTLQALCAVQGRTLVVTPTSVLHSWADQIRQFRPGLSVAIYHGGQRSLDLESQSDITLTTYGVLRMDRQALSSVAWNTVILDEAQTIKNPESRTSKAAHSLRAEFKIALTGTPVENRLEDLWSQFQFLIPGFLGTLESFRENYSGGSGGNREGLRRLRQQVKPFMLRRLKRDVAPELPPKIEKNLYCQFSPQEREVYQAILASTRKEVLEKLETGGNLLAALELLLRLRQACCHPFLIPGQAGNFDPSFQSSKIEVLMETLENSLELGHKALIFSQWTSLMDLIEPSLKAKGIPFLRLDGSTSNRAEIVAKFQAKDSKFPVFLISLKAGGVGLTLTAADHVYLMDPWWNPAVEEQAVDRAHRIGQTRGVVVHRVVAEETVEERILELQKAKTALAEAILTAQGGSGEQDITGALALTRQDLLGLLI